MKYRSKEEIRRAVIKHRNDKAIKMAKENPDKVAIIKKLFKTFDLEVDWKAEQTDYLNSLEG